jgi:pullulanase
MALALALMLTLSICVCPAFATEDSFSIVDNLYKESTGLRIKVSGELADPATAFTVTGPEGTVAIKSVTADPSKKNTYTITFEQPLNLYNEYTVSCMGVTTRLNAPSYYSTEEFESKYTYTGNDLGATWTKEKTSFRLWAPTASAVHINLYEAGTAGVDDLKERLPMTADANGTWVAEKAGDLNGVYYTYSVTVDGITREACDPYARATGVNGQRAMVIDLASTNPEGWGNDKDPNYNEGINDAIIYELHVRDLSIDESSGITNKGKYLGLIEAGTKNPYGQSTGLDYMKNLGITHIHLLPVYDYASVDESRLDVPQFNWGYDPLNYNVPEGSYSTDPYKGEVRVKEFKQMVKGLHDNGISVIMDVVYNHVYNAETFCFNRIVPGFFSRINERGNYSAGSGCGNDTASERAMVSKYIVDSVKYWADEYHIDGFRFDLVGLIDTETINTVVEEVHKTHPNVIFYGEVWTMSTDVTKDGYTMATQKNSIQTPGFAYFSDTIRDAIRGPMNNDSNSGYAAGTGGYAGTITNCFIASPSWCKSPTQSINYASCHDNLALFDKITLSNRNATMEERVKINNLAAAIVMTSQGTPLFQAGEEILRSKPKGDGTFDHNSYKSSDAINSLKWNNLNDPLYADTYEYYKGLIAFRKAHPALRMTSAEAVDTNVKPLRDLESNVNAYHINGGLIDDHLVVIFNPRKQATTVPLPEGKWDVCIDGENSGTTVLRSVEGSVSVDASSAMVLVQANAALQTEQTPDGFNPLFLIPIFAAVIIAGGAVFLVLKKRKS